MAIVPKLRVEGLPNVFFILFLFIPLFYYYFLISIKILSLVIRSHKYIIVLCLICFSSSCLFPWIPFLSPINYSLLSCPVCGMERLCVCMCV